MKKFKFRLEAVYKYRKELEKQAILEVERLRQEELKIANDIERIRMQHQSWAGHYNEAGQTSNQADRVILITQYLAALDLQQRQREQDHKQIIQIIGKAIEVVRQAYRARRQIEYLREKQWGEFQENVKKQEARDLDQASSLRFAHQNMEETVWSH